MTMLAIQLATETAPRSMQFNGFWVVAAFMAFFFSNLVTVIAFFKKSQNRTISPQPLRVEFEREFPSRHEFQKHVEENKKEHDRFDVRIGGVHRSAQEHATERVDALQNLQREEVRNLHQKIDTVGKEVSGLSATNVLQNQNIAAGNAKLDRLVERLIEGKRA